MNDQRERFSGIARLYSDTGLERLRRAHVCVVGIGGVGSWAVEALARSGIGRLTLIDLDEVCVSNVNRQLPALDGTIGRPKVDVMTERAHAINPLIEVHPYQVFFTEANALEMLEPGYDFLIDAIDNTLNKCLLIALCRQRGIPMITVGGAGGRRNPALLRIADLADASHDRLLAGVRARLRTDFGFPGGGRPFGVTSVFSTESVVYPWKDGTICGTREPGSDLSLHCASGYGTASFVTGAYGFAAAAHVVSRLAERANPPASAPSAGREPSQTDG